MKLARLAVAGLGAGALAGFGAGLLRGRPLGFVADVAGEPATDPPVAPRTHVDLHVEPPTLADADREYQER